MAQCLPSFYCPVLPCGGRGLERGHEIPPNVKEMLYLTREVSLVDHAVYMNVCAFDELLVAECSGDIHLPVRSQLRSLQPTQCM
jgi:hypothetical protein